MESVRFHPRRSALSAFMTSPISTCGRSKYPQSMESFFQAFFVRSKAYIEVRQIDMNRVFAWLPVLL